MDYFMHHADASNSEKTISLETKFGGTDGLIAYAIYFKTLEFLTKAGAFFVQKEFSNGTLERYFPKVKLEFILKVYVYLIDRRMIWGEIKKDVVILANPKAAEHTKSYMRQEYKRGNIEVSKDMPEWVKSIFITVILKDKTLLNNVEQSSAMLNKVEPIEVNRTELNRREGEENKFSPFLKFLEDMKLEFKKSKHGNTSPGDLFIAPLKQQDLEVLFNSQKDETVPLRAWKAYLNRFAEQWDELPTVQSFIKKFEYLIQQR